MTTLIQNEQKRQKIMARMREHLVPVLEHCRGGWVGLFLQGSQNYNLDYEGSDIDTKAIMLPSFSDFVLNAKPLSTTHIMENNEHVDFKDIRLMFDCIKKQNVNFVEILFTPYSIINPEYADLFQPVLDAREEIARYNNYAGMNCIMGMALEKQKAMEHPYPATMDKIEAFGYDPKQLHHALRLREFMTRYEAGEPYADCLISNQCDYLKEVKRGCYSLKEARALMSTAIQSMTEDKKRYMDTVPVSINQHANEVLQKAMVYRKYEEDEKARFHIVTPKTSAGVRIVPMLSEVKTALQAEWETQKIVGFNESVVDGYTGFIFQNRYGDPLSPHSVNRAIDRICAAYIEDETVLADQEGRDPILIRHFSAHNLRHTFCTRFCENERNIKVIQEIMGHANIETTMNIYAEATKEKKKESFSNLEGKIKIS